jgi:undecaprenyl-diphosphatase
MFENNLLINNIAKKEALLINDIQNFITQHKVLSSLLVILSAIFYLKYFIIILLLLYIYNKITQKQLIILFIAQIIVGTIKYTIKRERPYVSFSNIVTNIDTHSIDRYSFPSGHMTSSLLLAYFLNKNMNTYWFYIIPILTGLSRLYLGVHYPSDLLGGIILATIIIYASKE